MAVELSETSASVSGLLIDGDEATPWTAATLHLLADALQLQIPYLPRGATEFTHIAEWFRAKSSPENLQLVTSDGRVSLFGLQWAGHSEPSGLRASTGKLIANEAVLANREGPLTDQLEVQTVRSRCDGLNVFARSSSIETARKEDEEGKLQQLTYTVEGDTIASWRQGEATVSLRSDWRTAEAEDAYNRSTTITDNLVIESQFDSGPRPFFDHFVEQRKVANLLVFLFGKPISFREHRVRDDRLPARLMNGTVYHHPFVELLSRVTVRERTREVLSKSALGRPLAFLTQIGPAGLENWSERYDKWERFILPSIAVLQRRGAFIEDIVTSTSMSLEAAGHLIAEQENERETWRGRKPTTATFVYRCLRLLGVTWGPFITTEIGLARAIANNYNDMKHYDRGDFPDHDETYLVSLVNRQIIRLLAIHLTGADDLLEPYRKGTETRDLQQDFDVRELRVDEDGRWRSTASADDS